MAHIGGGQYLKADDPALVKKEGATLTGQPSSSSARPSAVRPLPTITKQEIMSHTVFRAPNRLEIRHGEAMQTQFEDVITCYRDSGKLHNYFAEETLDELGTKSGVREDHPIEVVMDTSLVAAECWLFKTRSEGICTRDTVPGSAILYIRDTRTDEMLYSAQADDTKEEDQDKEMERPTHVEAEVSPRASSPAAAASSGAAVVSPPSTPRLRDVPDVQRRGQVQECPQCRERIVVGQYICQHCNKGLRKRILHDAARRHLASARNQYVGNIATLTGKAVADLTEDDLRTTHGHDVMKRGMISLDANTIAQARKAIKRAAAEGHENIYQRFTRDRTYALRMIEAGFNQRMMRQWDCLIQAVLPNPGRSHAQRRMAQGSRSRDPTGTPSTGDLRPARFVSFDEDMRNFQGQNEIRMGSTIGDRLFFVPVWLTRLRTCLWPSLGLEAFSV